MLSKISGDENGRLPNAREQLVLRYRLLCLFNTLHPIKTRHLCDVGREIFKLHDTKEIRGTCIVSMLRHHWAGRHLYGSYFHSNAEIMDEKREFFS